MRRFTFIVESEVGLHARPATQLVVCASGFESDITLHARGSSCNAKSIFGVLGLDAGCGEQVTIEIDGSDEEQAEAALGQLAQTL